MTAVELHCARCRAHLGHVFTWPSGAGVANPTGLRYCIDGVCLRKAPRAAGEDGGAYLDNPYVLHELLVLVFSFALLLSCIATPIGVAAVISDMRKQMRLSTRSGQRVKAMDASESSTRSSLANEEVGATPSTQEGTATMPL